MTISEDQLETWAQIGAQQTSKTTYATIKGCLDGGNYRGKVVGSFLQGSYGNDTNIRVESDVDVVMELTGINYYDLSSLPLDQQIAYEAAVIPATYDFTAFRNDVLAALKARFGADVAPGTRAISIKASGNRRKADVLVCIEHHKHIPYPLGLPVPAQKVIGICFFKSDGTQVVNYPRLHSEQLTAKNQATNEWFKHLVRIFKNAREKLIRDGRLQRGVAPSYYIEGLLYNVPTENFGTNYATSMFKCLSFLHQADRSQFVCANRQYRLLDGNVDVTWNANDCNAYINALIGLWNQ